MNLSPCPLCSNPDTSAYHSDQARDYLHCPVCELVFAHPDSRLDRAEEFKRYELHQNDLDDLHYRAFLQKMCDPMLNRITEHSSGLDFGSGPGPLLKLMFEEKGHHMCHYDTFYAPDQDVFKTSYDFITATEVVEHLHQPMEELDRLWACLKPAGFFGIMTSLNMADLDFSSWHYIKDETHVVFWAPNTMIWLASRWGAHLEIIGNSVAIFQKTNDTEPGED